VDGNDLIRRTQPVPPAADEPSEEVQTENRLRPARFEDFIGQERLKENLEVFVESAKARGEALDHVLLAGPPGLGKTTLAHIVAAYMGSSIHVSSGPAIERKGDLAGILTKLRERDVLFIDEIHRLNAAVEETLYPAMEDFSFDLVTGEGAHAASIHLPLKPFTLVGATTRSGMLTSPLRDRFGIVFRLEFYPPNELKRIVLRSAGVLGVALDDEAAYEIARRSRGTPRIANRLLRRVSDFALFKGKPGIDVDLARYALDRLDVDDAGLDRLDRRYLDALIAKFSGGPTGIDTLAAALGEDRTTLEDVVEPFLLQEGFLQRTPRGRVASGPAYRALGLTPRAGADQGDLF
jgi:Holliday junction DNA helicase RuvB